MMIANYFGDQLISAIGWTVLHSLWQVSLIALIMSTFLYFINDKKANTRYIVSLGAMFMSIIVTIVSFIFFYVEKESSTSLSSVIESVSVLNEATLQGDTILQTIKAFFQTHLSLISNIWICGVLFFVFRLMGGYVYLQLLTTKHQGSHEILSYSLNKLKKQLNIKKSISIFQSNRISAPMVVGYVRPCILFPLGVVNQLSIDEVEAVIIHELAHIRRHDFLINILQSVGEIIFYYHPAAWWISANIKTERENCCDDVAIKHCKDSMAYAKVLVKLQELEYKNIPSLALGFSRNRKSLIHRVRRILNQPKIVSNMREKFLATLLFFSVALAFASESHKAIEILESPERLETTIQPLERIREEIPVKINRDTFPTKKKAKISISKSTDDETIELQSEDGEITSLKINGETISPEDYKEYEHLYEELDFGNRRKGFGFFQHEKNNNFPTHIFADSIEFWFEDGNIDSIIALNFGNESHRILSNSKDIAEKLKSFNLSFDSITKGLSIKSFDPSHFNMKGFEEFHFPNKIHFDSLINHERLNDLVREFGNHDEIIRFDMDNHDEIIQFRNKDFFGKNKPVDKIGRELNRDGLLEIGKQNKVELSGKHLKINGDKQARNIWSKYKTLYEEYTGMELTKSSKVELNIEGKKSKRLFNSI